MSRCPEFMSSFEVDWKMKLIVDGFRNESKLDVLAVQDKVDHWINEVVDALEHLGRADLLKA